MSKMGRNAGAVAAQFRNSAGSMKDKRAPRGGARNNNRELLSTLDEDREIAMEVAHVGEPPASFYDVNDDEDDFEFDNEPDEMFDDGDYDSYDDFFYDD